MVASPVAPSSSATPAPRFDWRRSALVVLVALAALWPVLRALRIHDADTAARVLLADAGRRPFGHEITGPHGPLGVVLAPGARGVWAVGGPLLLGAAALLVGAGLVGPGRRLGAPARLAAGAAVIGLLVWPPVAALVPAMGGWGLLLQRDWRRRGLASAAVVAALAALALAENRQAVLATAGLGLAVGVALAQRDRAGAGALLGGFCLCALGWSSITGQSPGGTLEWWRGALAHPGWGAHARAPAAEPLATNLVESIGLQPVAVLGGGDSAVRSSGLRWVGVPESERILFDRALGDRARRHLLGPTAPDAVLVAPAVASGSVPTGARADLMAVLLERYALAAAVDEWQLWTRREPAPMPPPVLSEWAAWPESGVLQLEARNEEIHLLEVRRPGSRAAWRLTLQQAALGGDTAPEAVKAVVVRGPRTERLVAAPLLDSAAGWEAWSLGAVPGARLKVNAIAEGVAPQQLEWRVRVVPNPGRGGVALAAWVNQAGLGLLPSDVRGRARPGLHEGRPALLLDPPAAVLVPMDPHRAEFRGYCAALGGPIEATVELWQLDGVRTPLWTRRIEPESGENDIRLDVDAYVSGYLHLGLRVADPDRPGTAVLRALEYRSPTAKLVETLPTLELVRRAGFANLPDRIRALFPAEILHVDGRPGLLVHAPGEVVFPIAPTAREIRGWFGMAERAWAEPDAGSDGAHFLVLWQSRIEQRVLLQRRLDPRREPADRSRQEFVLSLEGLDHGRLRLITDPGDPGDYSFDLTCWGDITIDQPAEAHTNIRLSADEWQAWGQFRVRPERAFARGEASPSHIGGRQAVFLHLPSEIVLRAEPQHRTLRGYFGFADGAWQEEAGTPGARFRIEWQDGNEIRVLLDRWLDPVARPADRGPQDFAVELPPTTGTGTILLRAVPGPSGSWAWGWSVWGGVELLEEPPVR
jgi:hypothetical protein